MFNRWLRGGVIFLGSRWMFFSNLGMVGWCGLSCLCTWVFCWVGVGVMSGGGCVGVLITGGGCVGRKT